MAGDICRGECIQHLLARGVVWCQLAGFDLLDTHGRAHAHRERDGLGYQGLNRVGFGVEAVVAVLYLRGCEPVAYCDACEWYHEFVLFLVARQDCARRCRHVVSCIRLPKDVKGIRLVLGVCLIKRLDTVVRIVFRA